MKNIYVGNLVYSATSEQVKELFSQFGKVFNVKLIYDRETKKPKGFGFVEMQEEALGKRSLNWTIRILWAERLG